jgi:hypothetical protein
MVGILSVSLNFSAKIAPKKIMANNRTITPKTGPVARAMLALEPGVFDGATV